MCSNGLAREGDEICSGEPGVAGGIFLEDCSSAGLGGGAGARPVAFAALGCCTGFLALRTPSENGCMRSLARLGGRSYDGVGTSLLSTNEVEVPTRLEVEAPGARPISVGCDLSSTAEASSDFLRRPPHTRRRRPLLFGGSGNGGGLVGVDGVFNDASAREAP